MAARHARRAKWESLCVSAVMVLVVAAAIFGLWTGTRNSAYIGFQNSLVSLAREAAANVDARIHEQLRRPDQLNGPEYTRLVEPLRRIIRAVPDIHYIYTLVRAPDGIHFVLDAADPHARSINGQPDQSGVWQLYPHESPTLALALGSPGHPGIPVASDVPMSDEWGTFMSGFAPLYDAEGHQIGVLGVDVDATKFLARQTASRNRALMGLAPAAVLIALVGSIYYRIRRRGLIDAHASVLSAQQDRLTGLPNRTVFMEHLERSLARVREGLQPGCAVLFFDFDRFKTVNDTLGHEAGDELLRQIGSRLQAALRLGDLWTHDVRSDLISRFGGDEFLVLVNRVHRPDEVVRVAERLLNALVPTYDILGHEVHSMASVGIVTSDQCVGSAEEMVRNADVAMYEAKRAGRGCSVLFSEAMHARLTRHLAIETSLRRAIGTDELYLEYQPVVDLETGARIALDVSMRWNHPTLGSIPQTEFLPIAEESGLLVAVGLWVIERACQELATWREAEQGPPPRTLNINLSSAEIALGDRLIEHVRATLRSTGLSAGRLQFSVPERDFSRSPEMERVLRELRALGARLQMAGFGAGHCSLAALKDQPLDAVKIDRTMLLDLHGNQGSLAVLSAMLNLVRNLGLLSVAEGIEDQAQLAILQSLGCHCGQGPLFGQPKPVVEVQRLLPCL